MLRVCAGRAAIRASATRYALPRHAFAATIIFAAYACLRFRCAFDIAAAT